MADMIGGQSFVRVEGAIDEPGKKFHELSRHEVDGWAVGEHGARADECELRAFRDYTSAGNANTLLATYKAMIGTVVAVQQYGTSKSNVMILNVREAADAERVTSPLYVGGIGPGAHWMETVWTVRKVS